MGLSLLVIIGWNFFYGSPEAQKQQQRQAQQATQQAPSAPGVPASSPLPAAPAQPGAPAAPAVAPTAPGAPTPPALPVAQQTREQAMEGVARAAIDTPSILGSINLRGGRIDDVRLKNYRQTIQSGSPIINLLNPSGAPEPYFVESGFVAQPGSDPDLRPALPARTLGGGFGTLALLGAALLALGGGILGLRGLFRRPG
jgi:YidC/Oxa1 family membrane protein insertase